MIPAKDPKQCAEDYNDEWVVAVVVVVVVVVAVEW